MNPTNPPRAERPNASAKPDTAFDAANEGTDAPEQGADVGSDRLDAGRASRKPPLEINEIEDLESDVEGG
jgi:hypothetical protein